MLPELLAHPTAANAPPGVAWDRHLQLPLRSTGEGVPDIGLARRCTSVNRAATETRCHRTGQVQGRDMHERRIEERVRALTPATRRLREPLARSERVRLTLPAQEVPQ